MPRKVTKPRPRKKPVRKTATKRRTPKKRAPSAKALIGKRTGTFTLLAASGTVSVTVARTISAGGLLSAKLNTKSLVFVGDNAHAVVGVGQRNTLAWLVIGAAGIAWSIKVTEPANAACADSGTLDSAGREAGVCVFNT